MNNLGNINTTQQRPISQVTPAASNNGVAQQQFLGAVAPQLSQPQFNANILQLLLILIQQLVQLINDQKPDQPQDQTLNTDDTTRDKLADILGVPANTVKVTDRDGNGQLSAGDLVEGTVKNDINEDEAVRYELSDLALKGINGELGSPLTLTAETGAALNNVDAVKNGSNPTQLNSIEKVLDSDGSGRISAGDVVAIRAGGIPPFSLNYVELSTDDVKQFEDQAYGQDLALSQDDLRRLTGLEYPGAFGGTPPFIQRAFDTDGDGQVSAGDTIETAITRPGTVLEVDIEYSKITQEVADQFNQTTNNPLPAIVSDGNVTVGGSQRSGELIPDDRVVTIEGRNYSVGFMKQQVNDYANSPYAEFPEGIAVGQVTKETAWGGSSLAYYADQFESYISDTFPNGDPEVPANPPVRYEDRGILVVNNQAYASHLTDPQFIGRVDSLIIQNSPENQDAVRQIIDTFPEVQVISDNTGSDGFIVDVPSDYYGQWQAALTDNLPAGSAVFVPAQDFDNPSL
jgi:hypothetical protein